MIQSRTIDRRTSFGGLPNAPNGAAAAEVANPSPPSGSIGKDRPEAARRSLMRRVYGS